MQEERKKAGRQWELNVIFGEKIGQPFTVAGEMLGKAIGADEGALAVLSDPKKELPIRRRKRATEFALQP